jgi:hypothetical protein
VQPADGPFLQVPWGHLCCRPCSKGGLGEDHSSFHLGFCLIASYQVQLEACSLFASSLPETPRYLAKLQQLCDLMVADARFAQSQQALGLAVSGMRTRASRALFRSYPILLASP